MSPTTVAVILLVESRSYFRAIAGKLVQIVPLGLQQIAFSGYDGYITDVELRGLPEDDTYQCNLSCCAATKMSNTLY